MAMYALGMSVLQSKLSIDDEGEVIAVKNAAFADDLTGAGKVNDLLKWRKRLMNIGPLFGYVPNPAKSWLVVKPEKLDLAKNIFKDEQINITNEGQRHLGAAVGSVDFKETYVKEKVIEWTLEVTNLSKFAETEPHAAYTAFTFGLRHKWDYVSRTVPDIENLMQPLEDCIRNIFIPAITGGHECTDVERELLSLPPRLGGLGIINPVKNVEKEFLNSCKLTESLTSHIVNQAIGERIDENEIYKLRREISKLRLDDQRKKQSKILDCLEEPEKRRIEMAQEKGASNWLSSLPIQAKGFSLNKQEFFDAIALRYGWPI